jgi:hypothetical protein
MGSGLGRGKMGRQSRWYRPQAEVALNASNLPGCLCSLCVCDVDVQLPIQKRLLTGDKEHEGTPSILTPLPILS